MKLKELSGDRDLYDVMKKSKKKKRKEDMKNAANYKKKEKANVFDFLNKKIGIKKGIFINYFEFMPFYRI